MLEMPVKPSAPKGFVVAGPSSGVGKTTVSLALMAALRARGLVVQPFKCGPDYIDPGHHALVCGRAPRNLDGWMLSAEANQQIFARAAVGADVCIVEGMMGLFDGVSGASEAGSTAQMAKLLDLPVILVVDASAMARSAAAMVLGFQAFDPALRLAGVIFNKVAGDAHYGMLRDAVEQRTQTAVLGYFPQEHRARIPERYLGLHTAAEAPLQETTLTLLAELAERCMPIGKFMELAPPLATGTREICATARPRIKPQFPMRIGVARDQAFSFYYEDNLVALRDAGAEIVEFSPIADRQLPESLDALYWGGGYPELYAKALAANREMIGAVRAFAAAGSPIYAECGGLMYLAREIALLDGTTVPMADILPLRVEMTDRLVNFGYVQVAFTADNLLGSAGTIVRGHSFHHSMAVVAEPIEHVYSARNPMTGRGEAEGYRLGNVLASYYHLHFLSSDGLATAFVENAGRKAMGAPAGIGVHVKPAARGAGKVTR